MLNSLEARSCVFIRFSRAYRDPMQGECALNAHAAYYRRPVQVVGLDRLPPQR
jgi:hypothetical protein